jgi:hypothetical protein
MDISKQKFFVGTGCSYGRIIDSLHNFINHKDALKRNNIDLDNEVSFDGSDNIVFINASGPSQGSDYQSDSIIYVISRLLELGATTTNIYCVVEWSEIGRISFNIPTGVDINTDFMNWKKWGGDTVQGIYEYSSEFPNAIGEITQGFADSTDLTLYLKDKIDVYSDQIGQCHSKLGNTYYISTGTWDYNKKINEPMFEIMCDEYEKAALKLPHEFFVRRYVDNIVKLQTFLKKWNIKYNFCQIYSQFSGWYEFEDGTKRQFHIHDDNKWYNSRLFKKRFPNNKSKDVSEVYPNIKPVYNLIDWDNFWFHKDKTGVFPKGGIDEYCIDTFGESSYGNAITDIIRWFKYPLELPTTGVTGHPGILYYFFLTNNVIKNCDFFNINEEMLKKLRKLQEIDSVSDEMSETLLFKSEKFTQRQFNNQVSDMEVEKFIQKNVQNI